jgi:hypothetical protein
LDRCKGRERDPQAASGFFDSIKNDLKTKETLKPFAQDEVSSVKFLNNALRRAECPEQAGAMQPGAQTTAQAG